MRPFDAPTHRVPSALWLWGFWAYTEAAFAAFGLSLYAPMPVDRLLRCVAGALLIVGGAHQLRVVDYKRATRGPYSTYGPHSYLIQRQTGWRAMVLGVVLIGSAVVGLYAHPRGRSWRDRCRRGQWHRRQ
jgi:hypothetical protein